MDNNQQLNKDRNPRLDGDSIDILEKAPESPANAAAKPRNPGNSGGGGAGASNGSSGQVNAPTTTAVGPPAAANLINAQRSGDDFEDGIEELDPTG